MDFFPTYLYFGWLLMSCMRILITALSVVLVENTPLYPL